MQDVANHGSSAPKFRVQDGAPRPTSGVLQRGGCGSSAAGRLLLDLVVGLAGRASPMQAKSTATQIIAAYGVAWHAW